MSKTKEATATAPVNDEFDSLGLNAEIKGQIDDDIKVFDETMSQEVEESSKDDAPASEGPEGGTSTDSEPDQEYDNEDEDFAKGALEFIDETRALWLSTVATGSIDDADRFIYYKGLDKGKHRLTVKAAAQLSRQYRLGQSPLLILLVSLCVSTWVMWRRAKQESKQRKDKEQTQTNTSRPTAPNGAKLVKLKVV